MEKRSVHRWIINRHDFLKTPIVAMTVLSAIMSTTAIGFAYATKLTLDSVQSGEDEAFTISAIFLVGVLILQIVVKMISRYMGAYYTTLSDNRMKKRLYKTFLSADYQTLNRHHTGTLMNAIESDSRTLSEGLVSLIPQAVFLILRFALAFALLFYLDLLFGTLMLAVGLVFLAGSILIRKAIKTRHNALKDSEARRRGFIQETLSHVSLIKTFEAETYSGDILENHQSDYIRAVMRKHRLMVFASSALNLFFAGGYAFAIVYGAIQMQAGTLMVGSLVAIIQLVQYMQSPFSGLSSLLPKYYGMLASAERLMTFEGIQREKEKNPVDVNPLEKLALEEVGFKYDSAWILSNFSLHLNAGSFIHIRGDSGIGKTTLFKLLLGLLEPEKGTMKLETTDGEHFDIGVDTRAYFTYVPQGHMILSGTIYENIAFNSQDATIDSVKKAARIAALDETIESLEKGYETRLNEKGKGLSEGQLQRLALARALHRDAPILLLDEVTSALDEATEQQVLRNIKSLTVKTCLVISHRVIPDSIADQVVSFDAAQ